MQGQFPDIQGRQLPLAVTELLVPACENLESGLWNTPPRHADIQRFCAYWLMRDSAADGQQILELFDDGPPCLDAGIARSWPFPAREQRRDHYLVREAEPNIKTGRAIVDDRALVIGADAIAEDFASSACAQTAMQ